MSDRLRNAFLILLIVALQWQPLGGMAWCGQSFFGAGAQDCCCQLPESSPQAGGQGEATQLGSCCGTSETDSPSGDHSPTEQESEPSEEPCECTASPVQAPLLPPQVPTIASGQALLVAAHAARPWCGFGSELVASERMIPPERTRPLAQQQPLWIVFQVFRL